MPRVQRSLSAEDLYHRYQNQPRQEESRSQNSPNISEPLHQPRDLRGLRRPRSPSPPRQAPRLSPRLPDPPIFNGTSHVPFDDWKMRIQDKLNHNGDHYPTESFKIAYVIARLGGGASQHVSVRRRYRSYSTAKELLDHMTDLYEVPFTVIRQTQQRVYKRMEQGNRPFMEFYRDLMKCAEQINGLPNHDIDVDMSDLIYKSELRWCDKSTATSIKIDMQIENRDPKARLRKWIMGTQLGYQQFVEDLAEKKAARFAEQFAKAKAEADAKKGKGKYSIIARPNPACQEDSDDDEVLDIYEADVRAWDRAMTN